MSTEISNDPDNGGSGPEAVSILEMFGLPTDMEDGLEEELRDDGGDDELFPGLPKPPPQQQTATLPAETTSINPPGKGYSSAEDPPVVEIVDVERDEREREENIPPDVLDGDFLDLGDEAAAALKQKNDVVKAEPTDDLSMFTTANKAAPSSSSPQKEKSLSPTSLRRKQREKDTTSRGGKDQRSSSSRRHHDRRHHHDRRGGHRSRTRSPPPRRRRSSRSPPRRHRSSRSPPPRRSRSRSRSPGGSSRRRGSPRYDNYIVSQNSSRRKSFSPPEILIEKEVSSSSSHRRSTSRRSDGDRYDPKRPTTSSSGDHRRRSSPSRRDSPRRRDETDRSREPKTPREKESWRIDEARHQRLKEEFVNRCMAGQTGLRVDWDTMRILRADGGPIGPAPPPPRKTRFDLSDNLRQVELEREAQRTLNKFLEARRRVAAFNPELAKTQQQVHVQLLMSKTQNAVAPAYPTTSTNHLSPYPSAAGATAGYTTSLGTGAYANTRTTAGYPYTPAGYPATGTGAYATAGTVESVGTYPASTGAAAYSASGAATYPASAMAPFGTGAYHPAYPSSGTTAYLTSSTAAAEKTAAVAKPWWDLNFTSPGTNQPYFTVRQQQLMQQVLQQQQSKQSAAASNSNPNYPQYNTGTGTGPANAAPVVQGVPKPTGGSNLGETPMDLEDSNNADNNPNAASIKDLLSKLLMVEKDKPLPPDLLAEISLKLNAADESTNRDGRTSDDESYRRLPDYNNQGVSTTATPNPASPSKPAAVHPAHAQAQKQVNLSSNPASLGYASSNPYGGNYTGGSATTNPSDANVIPQPSSAASYPSASNSSSYPTFDVPPPAYPPRPSQATSLPTGIIQQQRPHGVDPNPYHNMPISAADLPQNPPRMSYPPLPVNLGPQSFMTGVAIGHPPAQQFRQSSPPRRPAPAPRGIRFRFSHMPPARMFGAAMDEKNAEIQGIRKMLSQQGQNMLASRFNPQSVFDAHRGEREGTLIIDVDHNLARQIDMNIQKIRWIEITKIDLMAPAR